MRKQFDKSFRSHHPFVPIVSTRITNALNRCSRSLNIFPKNHLLVGICIMCPLSRPYSLRIGVLPGLITASWYLELHFYLRNSEFPPFIPWNTFFALQSQQQRVIVTSRSRWWETFSSLSNNIHPRIIQDLCRVRRDALGRRRREIRPIRENAPQVVEDDDEDEGELTNHRWVFIGWETAYALTCGLLPIFFCIVLCYGRWLKVCRLLAKQKWRGIGAMGVVTILLAALLLCLTAYFERWGQNSLSNDISVPTPTTEEPSYFEDKEIPTVFLDYATSHNSATSSPWDGLYVVYEIPGNNTLAHSLMGLVRWIHDFASTTPLLTPNNWCVCLFPHSTLNWLNCSTWVETY